MGITAQATTYATTFAYTPVNTRAARDAWCPVHNEDPAPLAYPFGFPKD